MKCLPGARHHGDGGLHEVGSVIKPILEMGKEVQRGLVSCSRLLSS